MPIVDVEGIQFEDSKLKIELMRQMRVWVSGVEELEVRPEHVIPGIKDVMRLEPGKFISIYVQELFTESMWGKLRTAEIRKKLLLAIGEGFNRFIESHADELVDSIEDLINQAFINIRPRVAAVIIRMVDRAEWEYINWKIPSPSEK